MRAPGSHRVSSQRAWRARLRAATAFALAATATSVSAQRTSLSVDVVGGAGYATNPLLDVGDDTESAFAELSVVPRLSLIDEASVSTLELRYRRTEYFQRYDATEDYGAAASTSRSLTERLSFNAEVSFDSSIIGERGFDALLAGTGPITGPTFGTDVGTGTGTGTGAGTGVGTGTGIGVGAGFTPGFGSGVTILPDDLNQLGLIGLRERQNRFAAAVGAQFRASASDSFQGSLNFSKSTYGGRLNDLGFLTYGGSLGYARALSTLTQVGVQTSAQQIDYDRRGSSSGVYALQGTLSTRLGPNYTFSGAAGVQYIDRQFQGRSGGSTGLSGNASLCRKDERTDLCLRAFREAAATGFGQVSRVYGAGLDGSYRLGEADFLRARVSYSNSDGQGVDGGLGATSFLNSGVSYDRRLSQRLSGGASLGYRDAYDSVVGRPADVSAQIFVRARLGDLR